VKLHVKDHDAWVDARGGRITASKAHLVMTGGPAALTTYLEQLRAERNGVNTFDNNDFPATSWGKEYEPEARNMFALVAGVDVDPPPLFYTHNAYPDEIGASPDGVVQPGAAPLEVKCPFNPEVHEGSRHQIPRQGYAQLHFQMWTMCAEFGYFVSYDPRVKNSKGVRIGDVIIHRVEADRAFMQTLEQKVLELREHLLEGTNPEAFDVASGSIPQLF